MCLARKFCIRVDLAINFLDLITCCSFFRHTSKVQWLFKFRWLHWKNQIKIYQTTISFFIIKIRFEVDRKQIFSSENWEIQVIVSIIMLAGSSEKILNPMRYTGIISSWCNYEWAKSTKFILGRLDDIQTALESSLKKSLWNF